MTITNITSPEQFASLIKENGSTPILVDFWAEWCGPCRIMNPVLEQLASEESNVKIAKVNVDENPDLAAYFGVMSIPTIIPFKDGEIATSPIIGVTNLHSLKEAVATLSR